MSQPHNQREQFEPLGKLDRKSGEFWLRNPWQADDNNLSGFERNFVLLNIGERKLLDISHLTTADVDSDSRGVAAADLTGDGMPELLVRSSGGGPLRVFENRFPKQNWLTVSLKGVRSNRLGIGAKIKVETKDRVIIRDLFPVCSFQSQMPSRAEIGLGQASRITRLTVLWPSGENQVLTDLPVDRHVQITEGQSGYRTVAAKSSVPVSAPMPAHVQR